MTPATAWHDPDRPGAVRDAAAAALDDLVSFGPRFHGWPGADRAAGHLRQKLEAAGLVVRRQQVLTAGWQPGTTHRLEVLAPQQRALRCWPMLWSGPSGGSVRGYLAEIGPQGLWGDSMVWRKLAVVDDHGTVLAYLHARDGGPAAPQPLPAGSDRSVAHLAIGRVDGVQLSEWLADGHRVQVEVECDAGPAPTAASSNLVVDIAGQGTAAGQRTGDGRGQGRVVVCAHTDTFFNTVGAYDNGSGTVALLLLATGWAASPPPVPVSAVFCTAEEWHLAGSRAYVASLSEPELAGIDYVLNIDGLGRGDLMELFCGPEGFERDVVGAVRRYAEARRPGLRVVSRFPPTRGTDDAAFYAAGLPTAFMTFNDLHRLHQPEDLPNEQIAANIAFTVPLVDHLVRTLTRPPVRPPRRDLL